MTLRLFLPQANANLFVKLLRERVSEMAELHKDEDVEVWIEREVRIEHTSLGEVRNEEGWSNRMLICIHHPKDDDSTARTSADREYECGDVHIDVVPLESNIYAANIHVSIDFDPLYEAPEIVLLFLELFEPIENAWGGVMKQLEEQSAVLREAIEEKYMMSRERIPTVEDVSDAIEAAEWVETPRPTPPFAADEADRRPEKPPRPAKPVRPFEDEDPRTQWFEYYYAMKRSGRKYTLKRMAEEMGYNPSYVRWLKMKYDRAHKDPAT